MIVVMEFDISLGKEMYDLAEERCKDIKTGKSGVIIIDKGANIQHFDKHDFIVLCSETRVTNEHTEQLRKRYKESLECGYLILDKGVKLKKL